MEEEPIEQIIKHNHHLDPTAIERSKRVRERLEALGINLGGYHIEPELGGTLKIKPD